MRVHIYLQTVLSHSIRRLSDAKVPLLYGALAITVQFNTEKRRRAVSINHFPEGHLWNYVLTERRTHPVPN